MTALYEPASHYWIAGGDESRLWSSSARAYVPADDGTFTSWASAGGVATRIASEADLDAVLIAAGAGDRAPNPQILVPYGAFRARWTDDELAGLFSVRKTTWQVDDYITLASGQGHVNLSGPTAAAAKALFVKLGVLTAERAAAIFATD